MTTYELHHSNGNATRYPESVEHAIRLARAAYGDEIVLADDWDTCGEHAERRLIWADEASAENDDGARSVCEIVRRTN